MTYQQAVTLANEIIAEGTHEAYVDYLNCHDRKDGYKVVAVVSEGKRVVEEVWHINADRSHPQYI